MNYKVKKIKTDNPNVSSTNKADIKPENCDQPCLSLNSIVSYGEFSFKILKRIGVGRCCEVYLGESSKQDSSQKQKIALKVFVANQNYEGALKREKKYAKQLSQHPNIVRTLGYFQFERKEILIHELLSFTLKDIILLHGGRSPSVWFIRTLAQDIMRGLIHMHGLGIVHGDLKLQNVMWDGQEESFKIIDFGVSFDVEEPMYHVVQSLAYQAPESAIWNEWVAYSRSKASCQKTSHSLEPTAFNGPSDQKCPGNLNPTCPKVPIVSTSLNDPCDPTFFHNPHDQNNLKHLNDPCDPTNPKCVSDSHGISVPANPKYLSDPSDVANPKNLNNSSEPDDPNCFSDPCSPADPKDLANTYYFSDPTDPKCPSNSKYFSDPLNLPDSCKPVNPSDSLNISDSLPNHSSPVKLTSSIDIWSVGAIMAEVVIGEKIYKMADDRDKLNSYLSTSLQRIQGLPDQFKQSLLTWILKCLEPSPDHRPQASECFRAPPLGPPQGEMDLVHLFPSTLDLLLLPTQVIRLLRLVPQDMNERDSQDLMESVFEVCESTGYRIIDSSFDSKTGSLYLRYGDVHTSKSVLETLKFTTVENIRLVPTFFPKRLFEERKLF